MSPTAHLATCRPDLLNYKGLHFRRQAGKRQCTEVCLRVQKKPKARELPQFFDLRPLMRCRADTRAEGEGSIFGAERGLGFIHCVESAQQVAVVNKTENHGKCDTQNERGCKHPDEPGGHALHNNPAKAECDGSKRNHEADAD